MDKTITVLDLGLAPYQSVWDLQRELHAGLLAGTGKETLLLVEHPPVVTLGRGAKQETLKVPVDQLEANGIEVFHIERGGDVTYHGPGQLVAYPILNLNHHRRDVGWYMRSLEEVVIQTLAEHGVPAIRIPGRTGVWVKQPHALAADGTPLTHKICSIGVRLSRWCTYHGLSVNVSQTTEGFNHIHPCGYSDVSVTSLEAELRTLARVMSPEHSTQSEIGLTEQVGDDLVSRVKHQITKNFCDVFDCEASIAT
jgi:lipoyl(octanoyl) transferase